MNHTRAPSPLATARPKNSSSSISSQHQQSSASQGLPQMPSSSKPRGTTPSTSRSPQQPQPSEGRPGRAPSKDSLKQKMAKVAEEPTRPSKADEVSLQVPTRTMQQRGRPRLTTTTTTATPSAAIRLRQPASTSHMQDMRPPALPALHDSMWPHLLLQRKHSYSACLPASAQLLTRTSVSAHGS